MVIPNIFVKNAQYPQTIECTVYTVEHQTFQSMYLHSDSLTLSHFLSSNYLFQSLKVLSQKSSPKHCLNESLVAEWIQIQMSAGFNLNPSQVCPYERDSVLGLRMLYVTAHYFLQGGELNAE